jgi:tetratricopeptide (TPR) repeat protein
LIALLAGAGLLAHAPAARADFDGPPKPRVDCSKPRNKSKPECQKSYREMSDDEIYSAAYWMAREGRYQEALAVLSGARSATDKRILNATGYAMRKLGKVDEALVYYAKALAIDPGYTKARGYLGEAYLSKGDLAGAKRQLAEIATRCGETCDGYGELAAEIAAYESRKTRGG